MPIHVTWDQILPDTLIIQFDGDWTWTEFHKMGEQVARMLSERETPIHIIHDFTTSSPPTKSPIVHLHHFAARIPQNGRDGLNVYVGASTYWKACITTFTRVYPRLAPDVVYVSESDTARAAIAKKIEQIALLADDDAVSPGTPERPAR